MRNLLGVRGPACEVGKANPGNLRQHDPPAIRLALPSREGVKTSHVQAR